MLTETDLPDEDIIGLVDEAMTYCDFKSAIVRIKEKHERIIHDFEAEAEA